MDKLANIFQESIKLIGENRFNELRRFYDNETLDKKIKDIIRKMQALSKKQQTDDLMTIGLLRFKDSLSIGDSEAIQTIIANQELPISFRHILQEINLLFETHQKQLNSYQQDVFFYKDMVQSVIGGKIIPQDDINKRDNISLDKRKSAILMMDKVKNGQEKNGQNSQKQKKDMKEEIEKLKIKNEQLSKKNKKLEQSLKKAEQKPKNLQQKLKKMQEQMNSMRIKKEGIEQSLQKKQKELQKQLLYRQTSDKQIKSAKVQIQTLKNSIQQTQKNKKDFEQSKNELLKQSQIKLKNEVQSKKKNQNQIKDNKKKLQQVQRNLNQKNTLLNKREEQLKKLQNQFAQYRQKNEKVEVDNELIKRASSLIESSQKFNELFNKYNPSSKFSSELSFNSSSINIEKVQLKPFLLKFMNEKHTFKVMKQYKNLQFAQILYRFPQEKNRGFFSIKNKRNLLIICQTKSGGVMIGFTQKGFNKLKGKQINKSFMFAVYKEQSIMLKLKKGKAGVKQDDDFLIFGNDQFYLQNRCTYFATQFNPDSIDQLDFQGKIQERQKFLEILDCQQQKIYLTSYTILELIFAK